jgi:hypothetical protein
MSTMGLTSRIKELARRLSVLDIDHRVTEISTFVHSERADASKETEARMEADTTRMLAAILRTTKGRKLFITPAAANVVGDNEVISTYRDPETGNFVYELKEGKIQ